MNRLCILVLAVMLPVVISSGPDARSQSGDDGLRLLKEAFELQQKAKSRDDLQAVLQKYEQALTIFKKERDVKSEGVTLNNIGEIYSSWGQYANALEYYEKSLAITRKIGPVKQEGNTLNNIGLAYTSLGQYTKALEYYEKALEIQRKVGDVKGEGVTLNNIGSVYGSWGQYAKQLEYLEKALAIHKKVGNTKEEGVTLGNIGAVYYHWGQYVKALEYWEKDLAITRKLGNVGGEGVTLNNIGKVYYHWGQYAKALEYYEKSLEIRRKIGDVNGEGLTLNNIGLVYKSWGQYAKALEYYEKSLEIRRKIGDVNGEATSVADIGAIFSLTGKQYEALAHYKKVLEIRQRMGVPTDLTRSGIGHIYLDMGQIAEAEPFVKESEKNDALGRLDLMKTDYHEARKHYEKLLKKAEENRSADDLFIAYTGLGRVFEALEEYGAAAEFYQKGVDSVEEARSNVPPPERRDFFEVRAGGFSRSDPGKGLTRVRMKLNQASGSIDSSEVTRARAFADNLFERSATTGSGLPQRVLDKEDSLLNQVAALKKELAKTDREKQSDRYESLSEEVKESESDLKSFIDKLRKDYPGYAAVKYPRPVTLAESALHPDEFVVMFDVSDEGVGVKLIHGKKIAETHYKDWPLSDLENDVKRFREPFETKKLKAFDPELGHALYTNLIAQVMGGVPKGKPIVVIPDGILAVLPFEALGTGGTTAWTKGTMGEYPEGVTYLGDEHPVSYYQSITALTLARTMGNKTQPGEKLLVVADPVFQMRDDRAQSVRQERVAGREGEFYVNVMKAIEDDSGVRFANLPETGVMADKLGEMFKPNSLVLTGLKANKADFLKDVAPKLDTYGRIVFATHGVFSTRILKEPFLALTMVPPGTDGFLRMSDILSLKMNADIVALTACQTGLGKELSGEGVMSMGRAFQYAGARAVLMSLWEVQVDSALLLVETFFQNLKAGKNKLDSLIAAREKVREEGYKHPFYWASFILVGEVN